MDNLSIFYVGTKQYSHVNILYYNCLKARGTRMEDNIRHLEECLFLSSDWNLVISSEVLNENNATFLAISFIFYSLTYIFLKSTIFISYYLKL